MRLSILILIVIMTGLDASKCEYAAELVPHSVRLFGLIESASLQFSLAAIVIKELGLTLQDHAGVRR